MTFFYDFVYGYRRYFSCRCVQIVYRGGVFEVTNNVFLTTGMVSQFPVDYAHCAVLGVMRKLLMIYMNGPYPTRLRAREIEAISTRLVCCAEYCPSELARRPRALSHVKYWKATEFRSFLCYTGVVALRGIVKEEVYGNFLLFSMGMRILLAPDDSLIRNALAKELLSNFVQHATQLFGDHVSTYNLHAITHLSDEALQCGAWLDTISAFPFENFLYQLKRLLRKPGATLQQVVNRTYESRALRPPKVSTAKKFMRLHNEGPLALGYTHCQQYKSVVTLHERFGTSERDCCVLTRTDDQVGIIRNVLKDDDEIYFVLNLYNRKADLFHEPVQSSQFGIHVVGELNTIVTVREIGDCRKCFRMPLSHANDSFVTSALLHD